MLKPEVSAWDVLLHLSSTVTARLDRQDQGDLDPGATLPQRYQATHTETQLIQSVSAKVVTRHLADRR